jgi:hypothetical protein
LKLVTGHDEKLNFLKTGHQIDWSRAGQGLVMTRLVEKASRPFNIKIENLISKNFRGDLKTDLKRILVEFFKTG